MDTIKIIELIIPIIQAIVWPIIVGISSFLLYLYKTSKSNEKIKASVKEFEEKTNIRLQELEAKIKDIKEDFSTFKEKDKQIIEKHREERAANRKFIDSLKIAFDPLNHYFFDKIIHCLENKSWETSYQDITKNNIADDMMIIKLSYWVTAYIKLFKEEKPFNWDSIEQYIMILIDDYHDKWRDVGIPEEAIKSFDEKHNKRADGLFQNTFLIIGDKNNNDLFSKIKFLDLSKVILDEAIHDINSVFRGIKIPYPYQSTCQNPFQGLSKHQIFSYKCYMKLFPTKNSNSKKD